MENSYEEVGAIIPQTVVEDVPGSAVMLYHLKLVTRLSQHVVLFIIYSTCHQLSGTHSPYFNGYTFEGLVPCLSSSNTLVWTTPQPKMVYESAGLIPGPMNGWLKGACLRSTVACNQKWTTTVPGPPHIIVSEIERDNA